MLKRSLFLCLIALTTVSAFAQDKPPVEPPKPQPKKESATEAAPRDARWMQRREALLAQRDKLKGNVDLLFVGDSITQGWSGAGKKVWAETWQPLKPFNIGIGGDQTQHVLWRLQNGEVEGLTPKAAVLMIGTNNLSRHSDEQIIAGITAVVKELQTRLPKTKILLLGVFPRHADANNPIRQRIKSINADIAKLDDGGKTVKFMDIGEKFLAEGGALTKEIMPDALHLSEKGYQIWAAAIKDAVAELMK